MSLIDIKAKVKFTTALNSGQIIHLNPDKKGLESRKGVPVEDARKMWRRGWIEDFKDEYVDSIKAEREEAETGRVARLERQNAKSIETVPGNTDGGAAKSPEGSSAGNAPAEVQYTIKHVGAGYYEVLNKQGVPAGEKIKGKAEAQAKADELNTAPTGGMVLQHPTGPTAGADTPAGRGEESQDGEPNDGDKEGQGEGADAGEEDQGNQDEQGPE